MTADSAIEAVSATRTSRSGNDGPRAADDRDAPSEGLEVFQPGGNEPRIALRRNGRVTRRQGMSSVPHAPRVDTSPMPRSGVLQQSSNRAGCAGSPSSATTGSPVSADQRLALAFCEVPPRVRPSPARCFGVCDCRRPRLGSSGDRKRRYHAAPAAKKPPMTGDKPMPRSPHPGPGRPSGSGRVDGQREDHDEDGALARRTDMTPSSQLATRTGDEDAADGQVWMK